LSDPDFIEARATIRALQLALDVAHARIRDNERVIAEMNARLAEQTEARDAAEITLLAMRERAEDDLIGADIPAQLPSRWRI
jgi:hypothetical protein